MKNKLLFILTISYLLNSCNHTTEEIIDKTSNVLPNGKRLIVEKTNKETTSIGVFSKHNYGTSHQFTYKILINPGNINWSGGTAEPKQLIFKNDTTYIRYLKKKRIKIKYTDSLDGAIKYKHQFEIHPFFQKHIDNRYFFNILGDDYWMDISLNDYLDVKKNGDVYVIPNDNEYSLDLVTN
jgi:hypothetical protein